MRVSRFAGRVAMLVVTLGLGTAVAAGYGIAAADTDAGGASSAGSASSSAANNSSDTRTRSATKAAAKPKAKSPKKRASTGPAEAAKAVASKTKTSKDDSDSGPDSDETPKASTKKTRSTSTTPAATPKSTSAVAEPESTSESPKARTRPPRTPEDGPAGPTTIPVSAETATESASPPTATGPADVEPGGEVATAPLHVVADLVDHSPSETPATPADTPAEWAAAALARRELATAPITASPEVTLTDAVVTGNVNAMTTSKNTLTYSVAGQPDAGGKVTLNATTGAFTFLPDESVVSARTTESFTVRISETTALVATLQSVPVFGGLVEPVVVTLRQIPIVNDALRPLIGSSVVVPVAVDISQVVPEDTPIAFTTMVTSFDGTRISTNFFPALGLKKDQTAPTILSGPGLANPGDTNPNSQWGGPYIGIAPLRAEGYNVVTWDPRGQFASGGVLQMNNPDYEGRDVSAIINWLALRSEAQLDDVDDPRMGMAGASYGGGIQLVTAAIDHRVDAIVPAETWHTLNSSLYKDSAFKTGYGMLLALGLVTSGANINPEIYNGLLSGSLLGYLSAEHQQILASSGPGDDLINEITAPTLLMQGTADVLFTLQEAMTNAQLLDANGVPVKMVWFCGGHGTCLTHSDESVLAIAMLSWLNRYVKGDETVDTGPQFEWIDQNGQNYSAELLPTDADFHGLSVVASGGGLLPIIPLLGGSGPSTHTPPPSSIADADTAAIALNTTVKPGVETQIVGSPELTLTYSGLGTGRQIYAQLVDDNTGLVIGNLVTPISVTLDGKVRTVTVPLEAIAQTMSATDSLTLQLVGSATPYLNLTSFGVINVSSISLSLPTVAAGVAARDEELQSVA